MNAVNLNFTGILSEETRERFLREKYEELAKAEANAKEARRKINLKNSRRVKIEV